MSPKLLLIELNEINFDYIQAYIGQGKLPTFKKLLESHKLHMTTSEAAYQDLEPWIQWVTAHTGLNLREHKVFRLGDIVSHDHIQIWEHLEEQGLRVGAISPMNARNRLRSPAFFVPDPWTATSVTGGSVLQKLSHALSQAVNDNAVGNVSRVSQKNLIVAVLKYARMSNYTSYIGNALKSQKQKWRRALFLDQLLSDVFIKELHANSVDFASLFLNAGAHVQHHYMFNSKAYCGDMYNPEWYVEKLSDPVFEVYRLYDRILSAIQKALPATRLMIATGLHQDPNPERIFYWRLVDHDNFLKKIKVPFVSVEPRMSRDFLVSCRDAEQAVAAEKQLASAQTLKGDALFEIDNRGCDLFVMLTYAQDVEPCLQIRVGNKTFPDFFNDVAFVALKNGRHNGIGYFLDTGATGEGLEAQFELSKLPNLVCRALGAPSMAG